MAAFRRISVVLAALAVAGCAGAPTYVTDYDGGYTIGEQRAQGPNLTVLVRGNPSTLPKAAFDKIVVDAMQGSASGLTNFTTSGSPNAVYRVVMIFNPSATTGGYALCARPLTADGAAGERGAARVPVVTALCRGDRSLSLAEGSIGAAGGPQGADFRGGVSQLALALFPLHNPDNSGRDCQSRRRC